MPRGRGGFNSGYFEERHKHGRGDGSGGSHPHSYQYVNVQNPNRNVMDKHMHFGTQIGYIITTVEM
ncbi:putative Zinc finger protein [Daphnia magna]|uniref:Putative Zinc finger protein n=1 Tax=Daphnia magna TaxID=35525 RepID=A0A162C8Y7_9CRUS|nr:putative Zinc finger protein [Daphnia magna]